MKCREKWTQSFSLARPIFQTFFCRAYRNKLFLFYSSLNKLFIFQFLLNNLFLAKKTYPPAVFNTAKYSTDIIYRIHQSTGIHLHSRQNKFMNSAQLRESLGFTQRWKFQLVHGAEPEIQKPTQATVDNDVRGQRGCSSSCAKLQVARVGHVLV